MQQVRQAEVLQKPVHASGMPAQENCGLFVVASRAGKGIPDDFLFRPIYGRLIRLWSDFQQCLREIFLANDVFRTKHHAALDGNVSPQKESSLNQLQGHLNFGQRFHAGSARLELTNTLQSTQDGGKVDYVLGGQGAFLPPLAISWFSKRFAWDPTIKLGYEWARQVAAGANDHEKSGDRLTYGVHWVIPVLDKYAFSLESSGLIELKRPVTGHRFHDKTSASLLLLIHEKDRTKVQTVFKYFHGEAAPAFTFNQSILLGLLFQLR